jgi:hypothetical protein
LLAEVIIFAPVVFWGSLIVIWVEIKLWALLDSSIEIDFYGIMVLLTAARIAAVLSDLELLGSGPR